MMIDQTQLTEALLDASIPVPSGLVDNLGRPAGRRFSVYRNNISVSLTDALEVGFPVIAKLLGKQNFRNIAHLFAHRSPPSSPILMFYGAEFPEFLENFEPLARYPYLRDVAQLEFTMRKSYHAKSSRAISFDALQNIPAEKLSKSILHLGPAVQLLCSQWPIHSIWRYNMESDVPTPEMVPQDVLITRPEFDPEPYLLPKGMAAFITALQQGNIFSTAIEAAENAGADMGSLSTTLAYLCQSNSIQSLSHPF